MSNIIDYLNWRGDIPISNISPFNEVDDLILTRFSYLNLDLINYKDNIKIEEISKEFTNINKDLFRDYRDKELIKLLGKSKRFKNMKITDYINHKDIEKSKQFGAVTIHINENEMYISFIGTDKSIVGIKEDCNMSFMKNISSQVEGLNYTNKIVNKYNKNFRLGGHSKGGNIAVFSGLYVNDFIKDKIISISNYDGPGFTKSIVEEKKNSQILEKITTYLPDESIVGMMLEHDEKYEIIKSSIEGLGQHNIYSWMVNYNSLIRVNNIKDKTILINKTIRDWLLNTDKKSREVFVDAVFNLIDYNAKDTYNDLLVNWKKEVPVIIDNYKELDSNQKKTINKMLKIFIKTAIDNFIHLKKVGRI